MLISRVMTVFQSENLRRFPKNNHPINHPINRCDYSWGSVSKLFIHVTSELAASQCLLLVQKTKLGSFKLGSVSNYTLIR